MSTGIHFIAKWELLISEKKCDLIYQCSWGMTVMRMKVYEYCRRMSIHWMTSLEHIGDIEMSWQHWPKTEVKVWWTIGMNEPSRILPNPKATMREWKCHVQEQPATIKWVSPFSNFPQSLLTNTSLFLSSFRRITYYCCIILPFWWIHCYLMF